MYVSEAIDDSLQGSLFIWNTLGFWSFLSLAEVSSLEVKHPCLVPMSIWTSGWNLAFTRVQVSVNSSQASNSMTSRSAGRQKWDVCQWTTEAEITAGLWGEQQKSFWKEGKELDSSNGQGQGMCFLSYLGWYQRKTSIWMRERCPWWEAMLSSSKHNKWLYRTY